MSNEKKGEFDKCKRLNGSLKWILLFIDAAELRWSNQPDEKITKMRKENKY